MGGSHSRPMARDRVACHDSHCRQHRTPHLYCSASVWAVSTSMRVLAFDMTASRITVGIARDGNAVGRWDAEATRGRSGTLDALIDQALSESNWTRQDIDGLGVVTGPGSLTATRIGWATASGWALAGNIPVTGWPAQATQRRWWCKTDALSRLGIANPEEHAVACVIHHRGDEFYLYHLSTDGEIGQPESIQLGKWAPTTGIPTVLVGSGIIGYRGRWVESIGQSAVIVSEDHALVGGDVLAEWATEAISDGHLLDPLKSPLDYGLPPQFRKAT
ncbi:MAG: tRNA (adenosine(37)-N6)-threonylcarbamoyltransferase complex dimerization subunit type 1 TsaB [candidate division Zixibacteria bacterium]|nr:tRNA (adenosine(37)-N6)-threonylcarbamoyltransferase complex dimerization subunit type 1 TsaB [candidate division Zixibacteria bacterium]